MIIDTVVSFVDNEILPYTIKIEIQEPGLTESLLVKAGELGLLGLAIPEEYGGMGKDFNTNSLLIEYLAKARSFSLSLGAHIGELVLYQLFISEMSNKNLTTYQN